MPVMLAKFYLFPSYHCIRRPRVGHHMCVNQARLVARLISIISNELSLKSYARYMKRKFPCVYIDLKSLNCVMRFRIQMPDSKEKRQCHVQCCISNSQLSKLPPAFPVLCHFRNVTSSIYIMTWAEKLCYWYCRGGRRGGGGTVLFCASCGASLVVIRPS